jgi:hypothetical protein
MGKKYCRRAEQFPKQCSEKLQQFACSKFGSASALPQTPWFFWSSPVCSPKKKEDEKINVSVQYGQKILQTSWAVAKTTLRKITVAAAACLLKIWQRFRTPTNPSYLFDHLLAQNLAALLHSDPPYFFDHFQFAHLRKERTKQLKIVYDMGKNIIVKLNDCQNNARKNCSSLLAQNLAFQVCSNAKEYLHKYNVASGRCRPVATGT